MENEEKLMTGEESLRVITEMINKTRVSITQSSFHLLFWGWLIFACSLSEFLLWKLTDWNNSWYVWLFVIPGVFVSMIYGFVRGKREKVFTYGTAIHVWTWMAFLVSSDSILYCLPDRDRQHWQIYAASGCNATVNLRCSTQVQATDVGCRLFLGSGAGGSFRRIDSIRTGDAGGYDRRLSDSRLFTQKKGQP